MNKLGKQDIQRDTKRRYIRGKGLLNCHATVENFNFKNFRVTAEKEKHKIINFYKMLKVIHFMCKH